MYNIVNLSHSANFETITSTLNIVKIQQLRAIHVTVDKLPIDVYIKTCLLKI